MTMMDDDDSHLLSFIRFRICRPYIKKSTLPLTLPSMAHKHDVAQSPWVELNILSRIGGYV